MQVELSVSDDKLKLFAKVIPQTQFATASDSELIEQVLTVTPERLMDYEVVRDIMRQLREGKGCEDRRVAKGEAPVLGKDGKIVWLVRRFQPGGSLNTGRELADFYNLGLFENIESGREVARVYRPKSGSMGTDVLGNPIASKPGKAIGARFDRSLELKSVEGRDDYQILVAVVSGYAHEEGEKVSIREVLVIPGNLDYEMGHIDFIGGVKVGGDVQKGFHIKAGGDIEVAGSVLGENQLTSDRSIIVKGFHQGGEGALVKAKGDYTVNIAHGVNAEISGNVIIQREARDCAFRSSSSVLAPQASVVGGNVWCVKGFEGKILGNPSGVTTTVELRNELEVTAEYRRIEESLKRHEVALAALELHVGPYLNNRKRVPLLAPKFKMKLTELINRYDGVQASLTKLNDAMKRMREAKVPGDDSKVNVTGMVYGGVVLSTTFATKKFQDAEKGPLTFRPESVGGEWVSQQYQPLQRG
jgi:uncharacterized protein (DUF342 family)